VTAPVNRISIAFHRRMGFSMIDSDCMVDDVPVVLNYDGVGEDRVIFMRALDTFLVER
jgi:hypothetical protein